VKTAGEILSEARHRHGISQARLGARAGTTQSAISRIERDQVSPTVETLASLLRVLGEDLELHSLPRDSGIDRTLIQERLRLTSAERVDYGLKFADFVSRNTGGGGSRSKRAA
jgi:transcriptional regulator with XRE-family HTH domain